MKESELTRAKTQISTFRANTNINRYSDEEYDSLQAQLYQTQNLLTEAKSVMSLKEM